MRPLITGVIIALIILAGCSQGTSAEDQTRTTARQIMTEDGFGDAAITSIVAGDAASRGADELYCVATDATTQNGELPYLLVVWRMGEQWQGTQLLEGYYEWDLQGCPR